MAKPASDLDIGYATGHELRALYDAGDLAPSEAVAAVFRRISAVNPHVNAFSALMEDEAMDAARASDARIAKGEARLRMAASSAIVLLTASVVTVGGGGAILCSAAGG